MKPRNCNACLALSYDGLRSKCDLNYPIKKTGEKYVPIVDETFIVFSPCEPCPKPKTHEEYAREIRYKLQLDSMKR